MTVQTRQALREADGNVGPERAHSSKKRKRYTEDSASRANVPKVSKQIDAQQNASIKDVKDKGNPPKQEPAKEKLIANKRDPKRDPANDGPKKPAGSQPLRKGSKRDYCSWTVEDPKTELRARHLKVSGSTTEQVHRLQQSEDDHSLPAKQAMEAAARKRRQDAAPDDPPARDGEPPMKKPKNLSDLSGSFERERKLRRYGPPVYDRLGYEYDSIEVGTGRSRPSKTTIMNGMNRSLAQTAEDHRRKWEIAFGATEEPGDFQWWIFEDRVAQELEIPFHKVEPCDVEIWKAKAFEAKIEDFRRSSVSKEEWDRVLDVAGGSALRK